MSRLALIVLSLTLAAAASAEPVKLTVRNTAGRDLSATPVTFGQVFAPGELRAARITVDGQPAVAQFDGKRKHPDGSWRFAVISVLLDKLPANGARTIEIADGPAVKPPPPPATSPREQLLAGDFDAAVTLALPDGATRSASARKLLTDAGDGKAPRLWLDGPVVTEWLLSGELLDPAGKPDGDLAVQFHVRYYPAVKLARVAVVVENMWDTWAGHIAYDVEATVCKGRPESVFTQTGVKHRPLSRWRKDLWWTEAGGSSPAAPPAVHLAHDNAHLLSTGALPHYDRSIQIDEKRLASLGQWLSGDEFNPMGSGSLTKYMPTTGGRPEIGPYPSWAVAYLLSMDPRAKAVVLANGDLAGSWPIHVRARKTGRLFTLDEHPNFWINSWQARDEKPVWQPDRAPRPDKNTAAGKAWQLTPDVAHQGSLAYIPYMVTGDFYYLEEMYFWANWCLLAQWHAPRKGAEGIMSDQVRGNAWGLRNIGDAGYLATDGDPEVDYFTRRINNNMAAMTARLYGPPEYNSFGFEGLRTVSNARIQNPANPKWMVIAPWEHDYLLWSLHHLTELGYADAARPRDFKLRLRIGTLVNGPDFDPKMAAPYRMVVGEKGDDGKVIFYEDWKKLQAENAKLYSPGLGGSYSLSARMAVICGIDAKFPKADQALRTLDANISDLQKRRAGELQWAICPRPAK